ncbi:type II restriction endonuclease [Cupriavidus sp. H39]|uniref:type II restriction endonuclease n=1 Tax=Cupriavidus sp. H39 TaxID=3401635 RepID=UPI003CFFC0DF
MNKGALSDYFQGVGTKTLQGTEIDPSISNGHELQGIDVFRAFLGTPAEKSSIQVTYVWLEDDAEPATLALHGTWYDSRRGKSHRGAEYRLYYPAGAEEVVYRAKSGDRLFLCKPQEGPVLALFCKRQSSIERQLLWLFGLPESDSTDLQQIDFREAGERQLDIAARYVLDLINVEVVTTEDSLLEKLLKHFREARENLFPPTVKFSHFARKMAADADPIADPDGALLSWMDLEERLFMTLERHFVGQRLQEGFVVDGQSDVDAFVGYSLSVHNRRKSRAGWAFGNHIEALLHEHSIVFKREARTEKRNGPDFLFPGEAEYHDGSFPASQLTMLAAKTSCKDRWRQVLAEADRISPKHLLTLEPGISLTQTLEMQRSNLHLVVPRSLHESYLREQLDQIMTVAEFIELLRARSRTCA